MNLKHDISSPKFYELLIKIEIKGDTTLDLKKFYDHINMCINVVTRIKEDLLPAYRSIKIHSKFELYFILDSSHPSYSCNSQTYTFLGYSLLVEFNNDTCVKSSMAPQA